MPFRSETEQLREQIRRALEDEAMLLTEKAELERNAEPPERRRAWLLGALAGIIVAGGVGVGAGLIVGGARAARRAEERRYMQAGELAHERDIVVQCKALSAELSAGLAECQNDQAEAERQRAEVEKMLKIIRETGPSPCPNPTDDPLNGCRRGP
jgi:hypothetical protein